MGVVPGPLQPLLRACSRYGAATAPLEVLRIQRPDHSLTCIRAFSGTLRHLILPEVPEPVAGKLPAVVATLTGLQVPAGRAPHLRHPLLTRAIFCGGLMFGISG